MANDLRNLDDALAEIDKLSISTSQGSYVKVEDVRRLMKEKTEQTAVETEAAPKPKTFAEAKAAIRENPELMDKIGGAKPTAGRAIPAAPTVVEDVKRSA